MTTEQTTHETSNTVVTLAGGTFSKAFVEELLDRYHPEQLAMYLTKALDMCTDQAISTGHAPEEAAKVIEALRVMRNIFTTGGESIDL